MKALLKYCGLERLAVEVQAADSGSSGSSAGETHALATCR